jgi:hypothetical protein
MKAHLQHCQGAYVESAHLHEHHREAIVLLTLCRGPTKGQREFLVLKPQLARVLEEPTCLPNQQGSSPGSAGEAAKV